ncbi:hypothetical protein CLU79DRAFT_883333 [Phycomyces nitens]|nr:hypothetical protein CLU79DRAFT_883333 [Phycomyces nitens]
MLQLPETPEKVFVILYAVDDNLLGMSIAIKEGLIRNGIDSDIYIPQDFTFNDSSTAIAQYGLKLLNPEQLADANGFIFGLPAYHDEFATDKKLIMETLGKEWKDSDLKGKYADTFIAGTNQGDVAIAALAAVTYISQHGMVVVPYGFSNSHLFDIIKAKSSESDYDLDPHQKTLPYYDQCNLQAQEFANLLKKEKIDQEHEVLVSTLAPGNAYNNSGSLAILPASPGSEKKISTEIEKFPSSQLAPGSKSPEAVQGAMAAKKAAVVVVNEAAAGGTTRFDDADAHQKPKTKSRGIKPEKREPEKPKKTSIWNKMLCCK